MDPKLKDPAWWKYFGFKPHDFYEIRPEVPRDLEGWGFRHDVARGIGVAVSPSNVIIQSIDPDTGLTAAGEYASPWKVIISKDAPLRMVALIVRGVLGTFLEQATE